MEDGGIAAGMGRARRPSGAGAQGAGPGQGQAPAGAKPQQGQGPGGMPSFWDGFGSVMIKDLIPAIDANFRTLTNRENRAMAGLSLGGTQTYQITQANLDKFAYIGIFSAPFGFPGVETGYNELLSKPDEFAKQVKVFYISMGSKEEPLQAGVFMSSLKRPVLSMFTLKHRAQHMNFRPGAKVCMDLRSSF